MASIGRLGRLSTRKRVSGRTIARKPKSERVTATKVEPATLKDVAPINRTRNGVVKGELTEAHLGQLGVVDHLLFEMKPNEVTSKRRWLYKINADGLVKYFTRYDGRYLLVWRMPV